MQILSGENLTKELNDEGLFDVFYTDYLNQFTNSMQIIFKKAELIWEDEREAKLELLCYLKGCLCDISTRTLIYDMNEYRNNRRNQFEDSRSVYQLYCKELKNGRIKEIVRKYPMLKYLVENKIKSTERLLQEILFCLKKDKMELHERFGIDTSVVSGVDLGSGDTHNCGKTVAMIRFASGDKIVYKPRSLKPEVAYGRLCQWVNQRDKTDDMRYAAVLDKKKYGWQSFVERKECKDIEEVKRYFRRMGKNIAVFYLMNATDFHGENIIPGGEYPYFIDMETLVSVNEKNSAEDSMIGQVQKQLADSVLISAILPMTTKNRLMDVDLSGLGARPGQKSQKIQFQEIVDKGTADIRYENRYFVTNDMDNSVVLHGKKINYVHFVDEIEKGFVKVYHMFLKEKEALKVELDRALSGGYYRQVLRGTFIYEKFLNTALNPKYMINKKAREHLLLIINSNHSSKGDYEVLQMMRNDIPYFMVDYDSTSLYTMDSVVDEHYCKKSVKELVREKIEGLHPKDLLRQVSFIRNSIILAKEDFMIADPFVGMKERLSCTGNRLENVLSSIVNRIEDYAIWNMDHSACSFLDIDFGENASITLLTDHLYQGLGMVWFLFAYADHTGEAKDQAFAEAALRGIENIYKEEKLTVSTSVFSGFFSYIYFYTNMYRLTKRKEFLEKRERLIQRIMEYDYEKESCVDVISGVAGAIIVMCHIQELEPRKEFEELIEAYSVFLIQKCRNEKKMLTGFSHGMAGFATALQLAGKILHKKIFLEEADNLSKREDRYYVKDAQNWLDLREKENNCEMFWCHGAPGILLGRSYYMNPKVFMEKYGTVLENIKEDIKYGTSGDSLCHGKIGNLDILFAIANNIDNLNLAEEVCDMYQDVTNTIVENGVEYGIPQVKGMVSFMLGLSGIGYGILRRLNPMLPCVLGLEIYGGKMDESV